MKATLSPEAAAFLGRPPISTTEPSRRHSLGLTFEDDEDTMPRKPKTEPATEAAAVKPKRKYARRSKIPPQGFDWTTGEVVPGTASGHRVVVKHFKLATTAGSTTTKFAIDSDGNVVVESKVGVAMMTPRDVHALETFLGQTRPIWAGDQAVAG